MPSRRSFVTGLAALPAAALVAPRAARAREPEIFQTGGIAINGADPVAYFAEARPVAGREDVTLEWMGAAWRFASAESRAAFEADPYAHAPAFGGYCAYAASRGYLAPTVPEAWTVHEGRLYLNASLRARELWLQDVPGNIARGEANWPGILG